VSAPEPTSPAGSWTVASRTVTFEVVQVAAWRGGTAALSERLQAAGWRLPAFGHSWSLDGRLACCVRPERWLLVAERTSGAPHGALHEACVAVVGDIGAVTDLSAARRAWRLHDPQARHKLAAGCRLDLDPAAFPPGRATVTLIAQVPVMVVSVDGGWLLMAPSSMGEHLDDWLRHVALG
jgi:heterotetrameric sarcosine oxidase gamma subunit